MIRHRHDDAKPKDGRPARRPHENEPPSWSVRAAKVRQAEEAEANRRLAEKLAGNEMLRRARQALEAVGNPGMQRVELMDYRGTGFRCEMVTSGWVMRVPIGDGEARVLLLNNGRTASEWIHDDTDRFTDYQFTRISVGDSGWYDHVPDHAFGPLREKVLELLRTHGADTAGVLAIRDPG